ncbi:UPF0739 protein C1orf74 homolog [Limulus polyphemus]|uniref:UPF0739 protein C1orf74 homolog n=1 Tax=Limulus polyphemus TaxID=6850 RepID=A0ABM1TAU5_LIMPO|nr:UPF0739 protein C1orf74 homolog [Limulus polyphemus]
MEDFQKSELRIFSKRIRSHSFRIELDILSVIHGLRPAYLWDKCLASPEEIQNFVRAFTGRFSTSSCKYRYKILDVLVLEESVFVVNLEALIDHLGRLVNDSSFPFIDVSFHLQKPALVSAGQSLTMNVIQNVENELRKYWEIQQQTESSHEPSIIKLSCDTLWNLTALFGILLNFPVIYWYNLETQRKGDNCLGMTTLRVHHIFGQINFMGSLIHHEILSFSIPKCVHSQIQQKICMWFFMLKNIVSSLCCACFEDIELISEEKVLPAVAL